MIQPGVGRKQLASIRSIFTNREQHRVVVPPLCVGMYTRSSHPVWIAHRVVSLNLPILEGETII